MGRIPYVFENGNEVAWPDDGGTVEEAIKTRDARLARIDELKAREGPSAQQHPYVFQGPNDVPFVSPYGDDLTPPEAEARRREWQDAVRKTRGE